MRALLILILCCFFTWAHAGAPKGLHAYIGFGNNFNFPGVARLGWNDWEAGNMAGGPIGIWKRNYFRSSYYTGFGLAFVGVNDTAYPAFIGGIGFDYDLWFGFGFRGELLGIAATSGLVMNRGNLGLSYDF